MENYIVIGHYHGKSLASKFIKMRSWWKSPITHTAALSKDLTTVYEAWWGTDFGAYDWNNQPNHTKGTKVDLFIIPCTAEQELSFYEKLEEMKGIPYDMAGVFWGFLSRITVQDRNKLFCTEAIQVALSHVGISFQDRIPAHKLTPSLGHISPIQKYLGTRYTP